MSATIVTHTKHGQHTFGLDKVLNVGNEHLVTACRHSNTYTYARLLNTWQFLTRLCDKINQLGTTERINLVTLRTINFECLESRCMQRLIRSIKPRLDSINILWFEIGTTVHEANQSRRWTMPNKRYRRISVNLVVERINSVHPNQHVQVI